MIHEFAVEPELIFEWAENRRDTAIFGNSFGLGHPRILARYPGNWDQQATRHADATYRRLMAAARSPEEEGRIETQKKRFDALMTRLVNNNVTLEREHLAFHEAKSWADNAVAHAPNPFHAIVARTKSSKSDYILTGDELYDHPRWKLKRSHMIARDANSITAAVTPILKRCQAVTFVDQYFHPNKTAEMGLLKTYLQILSATPRKDPPRIEVWCTEPKGVPWPTAATEFKNLNLGAELDVGWSIRIVCYRRRGGGEQIHNRYILTDIGGLVFAAGLSSGPKGSHDDITVMELDQYEHRNKQYSDPTTAFLLDPAESLTIHGTRRPPKTS